MGTEELTTRMFNKFRILKSEKFSKLHDQAGGARLQQDSQVYFRSHFKKVGKDSTMYDLLLLLPLLSLEKVKQIKYLTLCVKTSLKTLLVLRM